MPSHRIERVAEAIREVIAQSVLFELADPRVKGVTVLRAEVSGDLRNATVYVTVMGTEGQQKLAMRGLQHAAGFLQAKVAARLQTRFTPALSFKLDDSVKKSIAISRLIDEALAESNVPALETDAEPSEPPGSADDNEPDRAGHEPPDQP